jgi:hypothetical protein
MCFVLYAGTSEPMPLKPWREDAPSVNLTELSDREKPIVVHFSKANVQNVGSTSGCGCDFRHLMFQNGDWPFFEDDDEDDLDRERKSLEKRNLEGLVALLRTTGDASVELYGVWDGDFDFTTPPLHREEIEVEEILGRNFHFKEQGFYTVRISK